MLQVFFSPTVREGKCVRRASVSARAQMVAFQKARSAVLFCGRASSQPAWACVHASFEGLMVLAFWKQLARHTSRAATRQHPRPTARLFASPCPSPHRSRNTGTGGEARPARCVGCGRKCMTTRILLMKLESRPCRPQTRDRVFLRNSTFVLVR